MRSVLAKMLLLPCSKLYGMATYMRNKFFDWNLLRQHSFDVPVISVGNLAAGGTGKTPHVEYIVEAFCKSMKVAVLSRGYRRNTKGFIVAGATSTPRDIGDEAYQMYRKFGNKITVAVCENRVEGITELIRIQPDIKLIVLDDAFQHRYVKPTVSVLISEYNRPLYEDHLLPYGNLRESPAGVRRADIVIVSKCPRKMKPYDFRQRINDYDLSPWQHLYFSHFEYGELRPVFPDVATKVPYLEWLTEADTILAIAGIGNPKPFVRQVKSFKAKVKVDVFPDHHNFTRKDIDHIRARFESLRTTGKRIIITTEKDAVRLANNPYFPYEIKANTFFLPIKVDFDRYNDGPDILTVLAGVIRNKNAVVAARKQKNAPEDKG